MTDNLDLPPPWRGGSPVKGCGRRLVGAHVADDVRLHGRALWPVPARGAPMEIRRATASDADEIARIINAAFEMEREFRRGERTSPSEVRTSISMRHEILL